MERRSNNATRCGVQGNFEPRQCRRIPGEEGSTRLSGLNCFCVNRMNGEMISGTTRRVMDPDDIPDCTTRSKYEGKREIVIYRFYSPHGIQVCRMSVEQLIRE